MQNHPALRTPGTLCTINTIHFAPPPTPPIVLCTSYAISGTDFGYAPTSSSDAGPGQPYAAYGGW
eukprot:230297-Rhodomonas_salina.1